jgi:M6 family metalloprotease-like protein
MRPRILLGLSPLMLMLGCPGQCDVYSPPSAPSASVSSCKIPEDSLQRRQYGHLSSGFPLIQNNFENEGTFTVALIPIDFADVVGDSGFRIRVDQQMQLTSDWFRTVSGGRVTIEWKVHDQWVRIPGKSTDYALDRSRSDDDRLALAAIEASDPFVDYTGVRSINFLLPAGQTFMAEGVQGFLHSNFGYEKHRTDEGPIFNYTVAGKYFSAPNRNLWSYWVHEMGHMFGMPDLYHIGSQWWNNEPLPYDNYPFSGFDMMSSQDGPSRTLSSWLRFVFGWLDDSQVYCAPAQTLTTVDVTLVPLDDPSAGYKSVIIPTGTHTAVVIDSRRPNLLFDCPGTGNINSQWSGRSGVLVYEVDLKLGHGEGFAKPVVPIGRTMERLSTCGTPPQLNALLRPGDSVSAGGLSIVSLKSGSFDTIRITKTA